MCIWFFDKSVRSCLTSISQKILLFRVILAREFCINFNIIGAIQLRELEWFKQRRAYFVRSHINWHTNGAVSVPRERIRTKFHTETE